MNYKTDDSFFTVILPIRTPLKYWDIYKWAETDTNAVFRFIRDYEIEQDRYDNRPADWISRSC